jgi:hypothetical protein
VSSLSLTRHGLVTDTSVLPGYGVCKGAARPLGRVWSEGGWAAWVWSTGVWSGGVSGGAWPRMVSDAVRLGEARAQGRVPSRRPAAPGGRAWR